MICPFSHRWDDRTTSFSHTEDTWDDRNTSWGEIDEREFFICAKYQKIQQSDAKEEEEQKWWLYPEIV